MVLKTLCHEHVVIDLSMMKNDPDAQMLDGTAILEDLQQTVASGIQRIIDVTNIGMGRDVRTAKALCEKACVAVSFSTGFYKEPFFPKIVLEKSESELAALMIKEITDGIENTGERAKLIGEIGTGNEISPTEAKVFRAAALAQRETGVPIYTHMTLGRLGLEQVKILKAAGADLEKVVIGHVDLNPELDYYLRLLDHGVYLGFDTIGKQTYQPDALRASLIVKLSNRGYAEKLLLSTDITRLSHLRRYGGYGRAYLMESFVPMLRELGLSDRDLNLMLSEAPEKLFGPF
ncbi:MAG: phosphotriesterase-related protein [Candidatus Fermentithermobacillus carboniphilus]|uniref:Phosphotriesterase-related protein n=1 Tax=Candidatus Fermentithermobacillus carboniphilus TaxID=3085328 RepID=A0AAT9LF77_9FIRM|nr:MAG: phosphotriesterase-related protein [Candidatus Fermentithermobacillus carboniphilus]